MKNQQGSGFEGEEQLNRVFSLLGSLLEQRTVNPFGLVVCGGSALIALGLIPRATKDVDVVCLIDGGTLIPILRLPAVLMEAAVLVGLEMGLPKDWLNSGPASLLNESLPNQGLPSGFVERLIKREFGPVLSIFFISRIDQICFKLYAAADKGGPSVHFTDLAALQPTDGELIGAVAWARAHDPSPVFLDTVRAMLEAMERGDVVHRI